VLATESELHTLWRHALRFCLYPLVLLARREWNTAPSPGQIKFQIDMSRSRECSRKRERAEWRSCKHLFAPSLWTDLDLRYPFQRTADVDDRPNIPDIASRRALRLGLRIARATFHVAFVSGRSHRAEALCFVRLGFQPKNLEQLPISFKCTRFERTNKERSVAIPPGSARSRLRLHFRPDQRGIIASLSIPSVH
jgi:hypothetical protein